MEKFIYNPIKDKYPKGAVINNTTVKFTFKVSKFESVNYCSIVLHKDGEAELRFIMDREYVDERYIHYSYTTTFETGLYFYHFELDMGGNTLTLYKSDCLNATEVPNAEFVQLVYASESSVDKSFRKGIIYHIFVDRFCRVGRVHARAGLNLVPWDTPPEKEYSADGERVNFNCYGGNFAGIIEKLPYLKELGVCTIYLSPIFEANSSHKYDVADYSKIDSMFGSSEDFSELIKSAKSLGIKIIVDGVFNHTGSDSVYFNKNGRYKTIGAYQSENSKYFSWYDFYSYPDEYSCWWGMKTMPQTREDSGFFDYIAGKNGIIDKYLSMGVSGFRLDVADELTNNFLHAIYGATKKSSPKALVVGEVWEDASIKISYGERKDYFFGNSLDSVTNYPLKNAILDYLRTGNERLFVSVMNMILDQYPKNIQNNLMNILDTHDTVRALTYLGAESVDFNQNEKYILSDSELERGIERLKIASIIQYTVVGIPCVFYGDEVGIQGTKDPYCRQPYPWGQENYELLEWYKNLGRLRSFKVLEDGDMNIRYAGNGIVIYDRVKGNEKMIVAVNVSDKDFDFTLERTMTDFFSGERVSGALTITANTARVLY